MSAETRQRRVEMRGLWASRPAPEGAVDSLILFDGVCVFCSRWVQFVLRHDETRRFRFVAIQSAAGRELAVELGIDPEAPQTNAVILGGRVWFKSDAALEVLKRLPRTRWLGGLSVAPRGLRDVVYDRIANNRYRLFGRTEVCMVPDPADRDRFL